MSEKRVAVGRLRAVVGPPEGSPRRAAKVGGEPPEAFQVFPDGEYTYDWKGKAATAICDSDSRAAIVALFRERGNDLVIDYEHQTLDGDKAPAAGWIKDLEDRGEAGLWAHVEWTNEAAQYLRTGEYRYDSPVFDVDPETGRITALHHVALTNWPATHDRTALTEQIAAKARAWYERHATAREGGMDWNKEKARDLVRWGATIPSTATNNDVRNLLSKILEQIPGNDDLFIFDNSAGDTVAASMGITFGDAAAAAEPVPVTEVVAAKAVLEDLELPETATLAQVQAKLVDLRTQPEGMIAASVHAGVVAERDALKTKVAELEAKTDEEKLEQLIATNRRKVTPAKEDFVRRIAKAHGLTHTTEVVKNMADALPAEDLAAKEPPTPPAVDTTQIAATRRVGNKDVPVDQGSALRRAKVEAIQKEKPELKLTYAQANDELKRRESATS
jgi:phage I-like protein